MLDQLFHAIIDGNIPNIKTLLPLFSEEQLCAVNTSPAYNNSTALHMAIRAPAEKVDTIVALLIKKAPGMVNVPNGEGRTPIHGAAGLGLFDATKCLIHAGASLTGIDQNGRTILHWIADALLGRPVEVLKLCLEELQLRQLPNPDDFKKFINQQNINKQTALHRAATSSNPDIEVNIAITTLLLKAGCDPTIKDYRRQPAYFTNDRYGMGFADVAAQYAQKNAPQKPMSNFEKLQAAIKSKNLQSVKDTLNTGLALNLLETIGVLKETVLFFAIKTNDLAIVQSLVDYCPELVDTPNAYGNYPVTVAADNDVSYEIFEYLAIKKPVLLKTKGEFTALHRAATSCNNCITAHKFEKTLCLHKQLLSPEDYTILLNTREKWGKYAPLTRVLTYTEMTEVPELSLQLVTRLLEDGAEVTADEIFFAVKYNNYGAQIAMVLQASKKGTLESLLQQGMNIDATYPLSSLIQSATALYRAVQQGQITAVAALLKHGANPDLVCGENSLTPLGCALVGEMTEVLQLLLPYSKLPPQRIWDIAFNYQRQGDQYNPILVENLLAQPHCDKTEALRQAQQYDPTYIVKIAPPEDASITLAPPVAPILSSQSLRPSTPAVTPQDLHPVTLKPE